MVLRHIFHQNTNNSLFAASFEWTSHLFAPLLPPVHCALSTVHQNTTQTGKSEYQGRSAACAGHCAATKLEPFISKNASTALPLLTVILSYHSLVPSLFLSLPHSYIPPICSRCQVPLLRLTTVVKAFTLDIPGLWRNTELSRARLYFSSTPHSNSYQTQTQTRLITYLKHWKHTFSQTNAHFQIILCSHLHKIVEPAMQPHTLWDIKWRKTIGFWTHTGSHAHSVTPTYSKTASRGISVLIWW